MTTPLPRVETALEQVAAWQAEQEQAAESGRAAAEEQLQQARTQVDALQQQIQALQAQLAARQADLDAQQQQLTDLESQHEQLAEVDLSEQVAARRYAAIFEALQAQAVAIAERADAVRTAEAAYRAQVFDELERGDLAAIVEEYKQFKIDGASRLDALPESYRAVILQHHQSVTERIKAHLARELEDLPALDAPTLEVELVYAVDAPDGKPEVLVCVLPIRDTTFTQWDSRPADVCTHLGARVAQAIYESTRRTGPPGAQAIRGGHQGLLAMEVELDGATDEFETVLSDTLHVVLTASPEFAGARLRVVPRRVDFDSLLPPEEGEEA